MQLLGSSGRERGLLRGGGDPLPSRFSLLPDLCWLRPGLSSTLCCLVNSFFVKLLCKNHHNSCALCRFGSYLFRPGRVSDVFLSTSVSCCCFGFFSELLHAVWITGQESSRLLADQLNAAAVVSVADGLPVDAQLLKAVRLEVLEPKHIQNPDGQTLTTENGTYLEQVRQCGQDFRRSNLQDHRAGPEDGPLQSAGVRLLADGSQAVDEIAAALSLPRAALAGQHNALVDLPVQHCTERHVRYGKYMRAQFAQWLVLDEEVPVGLRVPPLCYRRPQQDSLQRAVPGLQQPLLSPGSPDLQQAVRLAGIQAQSDHGVVDDRPRRVPSADLQGTVGGGVLGEPGVDLYHTRLAIVFRGPGSFRSAHRDLQTGSSITHCPAPSASLLWRNKHTIRTTPGSDEERKISGVRELPPHNLRKCKPCIHLSFSYEVGIFLLSPAVKSLPPSFVLG
ncbi:hypothetical protein EYF80_031739 [Liparis tanakae]|uniref:Uncharacterized protein n=1 Tax=Liparis tanakae TaxID=230148 RepID=A0A4Z2GWN4_9TELE|nr:hypothetical protein EYF80_031739 [Liparis tanakae]